MSSGFRPGESLIVLDAGCGSGLLLNALEGRMATGLRYIGVDNLLQGLAAVRAKAVALGLPEKVLAVPADLTHPLPLREASVDVVVAHFSIYAIPGGAEKRRQAVQNLYRVLKPGGSLILTNPSKDYDAEAIVKESLRLEKERKGALVAGFKRWTTYPLTHHLGLKFIERQIQKGALHGYSEQEIQEEVESVGFTVESVETTYARSGWLVVGCKQEK